MSTSAAVAAIVVVVTSACFGIKQHHYDVLLCIVVAVVAFAEIPSHCYFYGCVFLVASAGSSPLAIRCCRRICNEM